MNFLRWIFRPNHYEIKIILATLLILLILPLLSVAVLATSGISAASQAIAAVNPVTHMVELFDPEGNRLHELQLTTVWPTKGYVSDEFGTRSSMRSNLGLGTHSGIDIANEYGLSGEKVTPFMTGEVIAVHRVDDNACGIYVKIQHAYDITSLYCHLAAATAVEQRQVAPGDIIGVMGDSGISTGPHTHFQVMVYGIPVNPRTFLVGNPERSTVRSVVPTF